MSLRTEIKVNTKRFEEGLREAHRRIAEFRPPTVVVPVFRRPLLRYRRRVRDDKHRCAECGAEIPRGRAGRTCPPCRGV